ncbi:hypothetical protein BpHYR1_018255 [Brachionus plicatilis]|uniref:Uncharacterized protein n=1 Tax=Brachionus plicatilis TaxID=10195 RepID=A0A3M7RW44_BRAPC|nr:hypothetical protein BpHYR1_018255 [Brachionus plicatilis]
MVSQFQILMVKTGKIVVLFVGIGKQNYNLKHFITVAFNLNIFDFPKVDLKIEGNRKRGRPKIAKPAIMKNFDNIRPQSLMEKKKKYKVSIVLSLNILFFEIKSSKNTSYLNKEKQAEII